MTKARQKLIDELKWSIASLQKHGLFYTADILKAALKELESTKNERED